MKKIYLFVFLLISGFGFAQIGNYEVKTVLNIKPGSGNYSSSCRNDVKVNLIYNDGTITVINEDIGGIPSDRYTAYEKIIKVLATRKPVKVQVSSSRNWKRKIGGCGGNGSFNGDERESTQFFSCLNNYTDIVRWWDDELIITNIPKLVVINPGVDNDLPTSSNITIKSNTGFLRSEYNWQYSLKSIPNSDVNSPDWIDLPQFQGQSSITTNATAILGANAVNYHGQQIHFRQKACGTTSESVYYIIRIDIPKILPSTTTTNVSCYDSESADGKVKIQFDRALFSGETLNVTLAKPIEGGAPVNYHEIVLNSDNSYTIEKLSRGDYHITINGFYNGSPTHSPYTELGGVPYQFKIGAPSPVDFSLSSTNVNCYGGQDGTITISLTGGTRDVAGNDYYSLDDGTTWVPFSNQALHTIINLAPNTYNIIVKDMNGCIARVQKIVDGNIELGEAKVLPKVITQPATPVSLSHSSIQEPTFHGGSNGKIIASITGGTPIEGNSYEYKWRNSNNEVISNDKTTTEFVSGVYAITLQDIPADTYTLQIRDANYSVTTDNLGCTIIPVISIELTQPDPIVVIFEVKQTISCNVSNEFGDETDQNPIDGQRDESQDGILTAHVTGGVPFNGFENNGLPYKYFWKKQIANGNWITLNDEDATAKNLSDGNYALNVEDANGIRLGTYVNNILTKEIDVTRFMAEPPKLELTFTKEDILCTQGNNGLATAHVTGGTPPYTYEWSNGETTQTITELTTNNYFVKITDTKGCSVQGSILIQQPNGVEVNETITNPICFEANDGSITLAPTGGVTPYQYLWNTGETTQNLSTLAAGTYTLTLTDANSCITIRTFELKNPDPIVINLGKDRTLCNDQVLDLDASIADNNAQYNWTSTNGFTSSEPKVTLNEAGTYLVKVTSSLGCIGEDEIEIKTNEVVINSEYLLSSQAYIDEEVILVNTSKPFGESTQWILPNDVTVVDKQDKHVTVKFKETGVYTIGLQQTQGECFAVYNKNITAEKRSTLPNAGSTPKFIIDFIVTPNPNDGNFQAIINLENISAVNLRLFSAAGHFTTINKKDSGKKNYQVDFNTNLPAGIYILALETEQQTLVKKIIIY
ncbi:T9SS type A sorting domain-containing protein [Flavobacterium sp. ALJ2]|uniref:T9SS type A sorting domain-containing protein n=1 Tax=Flavobacterium sp. ALJ2 TaxID=2786960 RepID=UPI00189F9CA0|nr:T9SS type A sorting domain-containing protein [Flavobacterium sp. ALJ2]MBF7093392.1 T9SS type A sorting domain-containing protein [Flavobacterium sp. ALJ2]